MKEFCIFVWLIRNRCKNNCVHSQLVMTYRRCFKCCYRFSNENPQAETTIGFKTTTNSFKFENHLKLLCLSVCRSLGLNLYTKLYVPHQSCASHLFCGIPCLRRECLSLFVDVSWMVSNDSWGGSNILVCIQ